MAKKKKEKKENKYTALGPYKTIWNRYIPWQKIGYQVEKDAESDTTIEKGINNFAYEQLQEEGLDPVIEIRMFFKQMFRKYELNETLSDDDFDHVKLLYYSVFSSDEVDDPLIKIRYIESGEDHYPLFECVHTSTKINNICSDNLIKRTLGDSETTPYKRKKSMTKNTASKVTMANLPINIKNGFIKHNKGNTFRINMVIFNYFNSPKYINIVASKNKKSATIKIPKESNGRSVFTHRYQSGDICFTSEIFGRIVEKTNNKRWYIINVTSDSITVGLNQNTPVGKEFDITEIGEQEVNVVKPQIQPTLDKEIEAMLEELDVKPIVEEQLILNEIIEEVKEPIIKEVVVEEVVEPVIVKEVVEPVIVKEVVEPVIEEVAPIPTTDSNLTTISNMTILEIVKLKLKATRNAKLQSKIDKLIKKQS